VIYQRRYIDSAARFPDAPRLSDRQRAALDLFDAALDDPALHLEMDLEPGDVQLVHNHQLLHDRTAFVEREKLVCSHVGEAGIEAAGVQQLVDFSVAWELPVPR